MTLPPGAREARRVGGGDINEAYRVVLSDGREAFVKTRSDAHPGEYAQEAEALRWLAEPGFVRTPAVLEVGEDFLALEWVVRGRLDVEGAEELGRDLAQTHLAGAPRFGDFRPEVAEDAGSSGGFGSLRLPNDPTEDWATFYAERRLRPLARLAEERGALQHPGIAAVERVCDRMAELTGPEEPPSRLHGDLWGGNVMGDSEGRAWLIDPSSYGGHREIDLAMLRLFGSPSERVFGAYEEAAPLAAGWEERVGLYQLLPLLVHALLFGGSYRESAERMAQRYA
jgi:fructosamine-3-kinase